MHVQPPRGLTETLRLHISSEMRWMCSQRTRSADIGFDGSSDLSVPVASSASDDVVGIHPAWRDNRPHPSSPRSRRWRCCRSRSARSRARRGACASAPRRRRARCRRRAAGRPRRKPARRVRSAPDRRRRYRRSVTVKPRVSMARDRRSRNGLSSSTIRSERSA